MEKHENSNRSTDMYRCRSKRVVQLGVCREYMERDVELNVIS